MSAGNKLGGKLRGQTQIKARLSKTLKSWLPILQSGATELEETLNNIAEENPYIEIKSQIAQSLQSHAKAPKRDRGAQMSNNFESTHISEKSLYEVLEEQIEGSRDFPTPRSRQIAFKIIENLNEDGYLDVAVAQIALELGFEEDEVERTRQRFARLEPHGIGARDIIESFLFQLYNSDLEGEGYELATHIIRNLHNHSKFKSHDKYNEVMKTIKTFNNPPAIEFSPRESEVIPDIFIYKQLKNDGAKNIYELEVSINDSYYPHIIIEERFGGKVLDESGAEFLKSRLKAARDMIDALNMRQATIKHIATSLLEHQYEFFMGGDIKPMKLKDIAQDLGYAPSTISRAIANKYLECDRGIFPIKSFFTAAIDGDTSNASIKDFILSLIKQEDMKKPLSDVKILKSVEEKFSLKMVRRTITKYRQQLDIPSSSERKRLYEVSMKNQRQA